MNNDPGHPQNRMNPNFEQKPRMTNPGVNLSIYENRHPSTQHMMKMLAPNTNLPNNLYDIAEDMFMLGHDRVLGTPDGPELTAGIRKLLEAKDCFVRAALDGEPVDYRDR